MSPPTPIESSFRLLTPREPAAIAVIRAFGPAAAEFARAHLRARRPLSDCRAGDVLRIELLDLDGEPIDDALLTVHAVEPTPDIRIHLHGGPWIVRRCEELLIRSGLSPEPETAARPLWPTRDRIDAAVQPWISRILTLDGIRWLLAAADRLRAELAGLRANPDLDAVRQRLAQIAAAPSRLDWYLHPLRVALVGPPNAGKSTLINALAGRPVSITSPTPGTTRDWVEVPGEAGGYPLLWRDTAGLRTPSGELEAAGIQRTTELIAESDAVVVVLDGTASADAVAAFVRDHASLDPAAVAWNKSDLGAAFRPATHALPESWRERGLAVSADKLDGVENLTAELIRRLCASVDDGVPEPVTESLRREIAFASAAPGLETSGFNIL